MDGGTHDAAMALTNVRVLTGVADGPPTKVARYDVADSGVHYLPEQEDKERRPNRVGILYRCGRCGEPKKGHVCVLPKDAPRRSRQPIRKPPGLYAHGNMYFTDASSALAAARGAYGGAAPNGVVLAAVVQPGAKPGAAATSSALPSEFAPAAAEPAISLEGIDGVRAVLARLKLEQYVEAFEDQGFDELTHLLTLDHDGLSSVASAVGMKPGHALRFTDMFDSEARTVITLAGYVIESHE